MNDLVSIVVPVYNKEECIVRCLNSLLRINYENTEILVIDDGSNDKSSLICKSFCENNSVFTYVRKENGGVSSARNYGINLAKGKYIYFVDADDYVSPNIIADTISNIGESDCLIFSCFSEYINRNVIDNSLCKTYLPNELFSFFLQHYNSYVMNNPWNKVYRSSVIKKNNLQFDESISLGEDLCFNIEYYSHCNEIRIINSQLYYYTYSELGLTNSKKDCLELWESEFKAFTTLKKIASFPSINLESNIVDNYILQRTKRVLSNCLGRYNYNECIILRKRIIKNMIDLSINSLSIYSFKSFLYILLSPVIYMIKKWKRPD